jgi:hypothetical protein
LEHLTRYILYFLGDPIIILVGGLPRSMIRACWWSNSFMALGAVGGNTAVILTHMMHTISWNQGFRMTAVLSHRQSIVNTVVN